MRKPLSSGNTCGYRKHRGITRYTELNIKKSTVQCSYEDFFHLGLLHSVTGPCAIDMLHMVPIEQDKQHRYDHESCSYNERNMRVVPLCQFTRHIWGYRCAEETQEAVSSGCSGAFDRSSIHHGRCNKRVVVFEQSSGNNDGGNNDSLP